MKSRGLGRGLSALLSDHSIEEAINQDQNTVHIDLLEPNKYQPRMIFDETALNELAESIKRNGLIQPIIVCKQDNQKYMIIAGERRWRACRLAGLHEVPIVIKIIDKTEKLLEFAIVENIQRQDLTIIEEAASYQQLMDEFNYTQENVSRILGKSRSHVANVLRLNSLPESVKDQVNQGLLSMGHARTLIGIDDAVEIANQIIKDNLNVRQTERLLQNKKKPKKSSSTAKKLVSDAMQDDDILNIQQLICTSLGLKVKIEDDEDGGKVTLFFDNLEQLDLLLQKLST